MKKDLEITSVSVFPIAQKSSLFAFGNAEINGQLRIGSIALHIGKKGEIKLNFPAKRIGEGLQFYCQPLSKEMSEKFRIAFEKKIKELNLFQNEET